MDNTISILLKTFESFFKRSVLPSSVLLLFLFISNKADITIFFQKINPILELEYGTYILTLMIIISLITLSFLMSILTQIVFDNTMKKNFNSLFLYNNTTLNNLRDKVITKLQQEENDKFENIEHTDYFLYQVIGRKLESFSIKTDTRRYIDDIKSSGIIFLSFILTILLKIITHFDIIYFLFEILLILTTWFIAWEYLKSKYRSRAIRIYINYLIGDKKS